MAQPTTPYKKSVSGSLGAGMKSLLGGNDRRYYVLEHKVSSKYHKAGENQRIIVDQIELGRASTCQVRFDETFATVSRRHAAIVKDGDNWKLVQLSKTNSTYLNGHRVEKEWYLQNGDEIQLSTNGPRMGFIVPAGEKGLVKSIGLSARLSLFRKQALRPYKQAIACLAGLFVLSGCLFTYKIIDQDSLIKKYRADQIQISNEYEEKLRAANEKIEHQEQEWADERIRQEERFKEKIDSLNEETGRAIDKAVRRIREQGGSEMGIDAMLRTQNIRKDVYFLMATKVVYVMNGREHQLFNENGDPYAWSGTGFLLNDGRFVTARHCVEGWLYSNPIGDDDVSAVVRASAVNSSIKIKSYLTAISTMSNTKFDFTSDDFTINHRLDKKQQIGTDENGQSIYWIFSWPGIDGLSELMWATDWAYTNKTNGHRGDLVPDGSLSKSLLPMQKLVASGFPQGIGVMDGSQDVDPIFSELTTSRQGLANNGCILHSRGTDHGNSGGPIFAIKDGKLVVVGIVSRGDHRTGEHNWAVPICNIL